MGKTLDETVPMRLINIFSGSTIMGIIIGETNDSFLVAFPARLLNEGGVIQVEPYVPVSYTRLFKTAIIAMTPILFEFEYHYIPYVLNCMDTNFPSYVTHDRKEYLEKRLAELIELNKAVTETVKKTDDNENNIENGTSGNNSILINSGSKYKH